RALRDLSGFELEEERRLLFVGMTRAKKRLFLTQTRLRTFRGRTLASIPSLFASELEADRVDESHGTPQVYFDRDAFDKPEGSDAPAAPPVDPPTMANNASVAEAKPLLMSGADLLNGGRPTGTANPNQFSKG